MPNCVSDAEQAAFARENCYLLQSVTPVSGGVTHIPKLGYGFIVSTLGGLSIELAFKAGNLDALPATAMELSAYKLVVVLINQRSPESEFAISNEVALMSRRIRPGMAVGDVGGQWRSAKLTLVGALATISVPWLEEAREFGYDKFLDEPLGALFRVVLAFDGPPPADQKRRNLQLREQQDRVYLTDMDKIVASPAQFECLQAPPFCRLCGQPGTRECSSTHWTSDEAMIKLFPLETVITATSKEKACETTRRVFGDGVFRTTGTEGDMTLASRSSILSVTMLAMTFPASHLI